MPPVWRGRRRWLLVSLITLGVLQAVFALFMALSVGAVLSAPEARWDLLTLLMLSVLGIGMARWMERIVAEQLGQDYVFEQRRRLIASAVLGEKGNKSLGVIVTRASNDLTAIRNWIAQGIVPLLTGLPLILVIVVVLFLLDWRIALAVSVPLALTALAIPGLSSAAFTRARTLRRHRGRMSAHIADTVRAGESVQISGAVSRELKAVDRNSSRVVEAAVDRARVTGFIRALTVTAASLCTVAVVLLSMLGHVDAAGVASVMTLLGVIATPMSDLGRVVEYRQNYRAAQRILAPVLAEAVALRKAERRRERAWNEGAIESYDGHEGLRIRELSESGVLLPDLDAVPGDRIRMISEHSGRVRGVIHELLLATSRDRDPQTADGLPFVLIDGKDYARAPMRERRELVGFASRDVPLERGSVRRLLTYRRPDAGDPEVEAVIERVGLTGVLQRELKGTAVKLKNDGAPWTASDVMRLKLARALMGTPPLLVLEDVTVGLDDEGIHLVRDILRDYPGVVLFATSGPEPTIGDYRVWDLDGETAQQREATRAAVTSRHDRGGSARSEDADDE